MLMGSKMEDIELQNELIVGSNDHSEVIVEEIIKSSIGVVNVPEESIDIVLMESDQILIKDLMDEGDTSSSAMKVENCEISEETAVEEAIRRATTGIVGYLTPISTNRHILCSNSSNKTCFSSSKKSNLRKSSKYETSPNGTPVDSNPTPRKRIRIIENLDAHNQNNHVSFDEDLFEEKQADVDTKIYRTNIFGEEIIWVSPSSVQLDMSIVNAETVRTSRLPVPKKFSVEIDMRFIDNETLEQIIECKQSINNAGAFEYEKLCSKMGLFRDRHSHHCRSSVNNSFKYEGNAMKLANLDAALDFDLTCPKNFFDNRTPENGSVFYFGDIWATSKGFREYILWKTQGYIETKGVLCKGFTMNASDGGKAETNYNEKTGVLFNSISPQNVMEYADLDTVPTELVESFIGEGNLDSKNGLDLLDTDATDGFVQRMLDGTDGNGVHLLVADNAECFNVHETVREIRFQRSMYCQCIVALLAVREGGNFVVKMFDSITLFTVGLIFLMHRCFKSISIHKPKTSPSHSSERFLICREKLDRESTEDIEQFLLESHAMVVKNEEIRRILRKKLRRKLEIHTMEVKELVPLRVIISHAEFFEFMRLNNIRLSKDLVITIKQVLSSVALQKESLVAQQLQAKQHGNDLRKRLGIHLYSLFTQKFVDPEQMLSYLQNQHGCENAFWRSGERNLTQLSLQEISESGSEWQVFVIQEGGERLLSNGRGLFIGLGKDKLFFFNGFRWNSVSVKNIEMTKGTVFYGEIVEQISSVDGAQRIQSSCQIFDIYFISGRFVGNLPFHQRKTLSKLYAAAIRKTTDSNLSILQVHESSGVGDLSNLLNSFGEIQVVGYSKRLRVHTAQLTPLNPAISVGGLLFWKTGGAENGFAKSMFGRVVCKMNRNQKSETSDECLILEDLLSLKI